MEQNAMFKLTYGLFAITAREGDRDNGCIINTATQITVEPNCITVAVNKKNFTHDMIIRTGEFNLSILSEKSTFETYKQLGFQSGRDTDKMKEISFARAENGIAYLTKECNAFLSAKVTQTVDLSTHTLFLAEVTQAVVLTEDESATYSYYQKNIKPAPAQTEKKGFVCEVCGYIYEGETLPEDFICPLCKHPASDFKPL